MTQTGFIRRRARRHWLPVLAMLVLTPAAAMSENEQNEKKEKPAHHKPDGGFRNPQPTFTERGFRDFIHFMFFTDRRHEPDEAKLALAPEERRWKPGGKHADWEVTWVGHSTLLVKIDDHYLLTDPVWSDRASPVSWAGPKRVVPPGIPFEDLPPIEAVLISHNHYDHLDVDTVERLAQTHDPTFFVPLGLKEWFADLGLDNVQEMDWWDHATFHGLEVHCVPVQHFSGRSPFDRDQTLWSGWSVIAPSGHFLHAGDSGYTPDFAEIRRRLGPPRLAAIPIGAYDPRDFMGPVHVDPAQAVQVHLDLEAGQSIGIHWGTFRLANDPLTEGPKLLRKALRDRGVDESAFWVFQQGEVRAVPPMQPGISEHPPERLAGPAKPKSPPANEDAIDL